MNLQNLLIALPAFLLTIGILVTVHEFGHFWVARKLGIKVLRFSVGFGKPLWTYVSPKDQTEYVIAALPLGGYVKMLDEREGEVPPEELHLAFNRQTVWKRLAVVAAGPIANFLLAILIYWVVFGVTGNPAMYPLVKPLPNTPAALAGFRPGDKIIQINGQPVSTFEESAMTLVESFLQDKTLQVQVETQGGGAAERRLDLTEVALFKEENDVLSKVGLEPWAPKLDLMLGQIVPGSPAEKAGLQPKDKVLAVDGNKPESADAFVKYIQQHADKPITLQIERASGLTDITVTPALKEKEGKQVGQVGAGVGEVVPPEVIANLQFKQRLGPIDSFTKSVQKTWQMSVVTLKLMGRMLTGEVSLKNISGPVTIAKYSGETASAGLPYYLGFLAVVSISLGILNFMPIPMLDGGHLLYYVIEIVKGSPVSPRFEEYGLRFGMAVVGCIMVLALYNDIMRLMN
ncbi:MAG TPA: RIP metalloprotease RseP [Thiolinea sp.]|nr:RIP metalloprotease RseP [Thiolinea sp.]